MSIKSSYPNIAPTLLLDFANTKDLDPRITFTRTTTARYYDGKTVAKAEENLFLQSAAFDNASWAKENASITANSVAAPDGTTTADTITVNDANGQHRVRFDSFAAVAGTYVVSIFAKKNTADFLIIREDLNGTATNSCFNLSTGALGTVGAGRTASITDFGNGWYRCVTTVTATAGTRVITFVVAATDNTNSYLGNNTDSIYIWGAQLEQRSSVTAYTATTTAPITNYIPQLLTAAAGQARFDHSPTTGESLGLLVEEQRANLLTWSEDFSNAAWIKARSSITSNTIVAPDGTLTGDKLVEDTTASNTHVIYPANYSATNVTLTASVYAKAAERSEFLLEISNFSTGFGGARFNLANGTFTGITNTGDYTGTSASITPVGNGWYRCSITTTKGNANSTNRWLIELYNGSTSYTGDGYSGIFIWGAQLEAGAFPTSYIPTTTASATRNADAASMTGVNFSSWYRADEGSVYSEWATPFGGFDRNVYEISFTDFNNRIFTYQQTNNGIQSSVVANGATQAQLFPGPANATATNKAVQVYKVNDFAAVANNGTVVTDVSGILPFVDRFSIGRAVSGNVVLNGTIKKIAFYPRRLTNAELQSLTTV